MKSLFAMLVGGLALFGHAQAGEILGTVSEAGRPLVDVPVRIRCEGGPRVIRGSSQTDEFGSYRLFVEGEGECVLSVRNLSTRVRSYASAQRYNVEVRSVAGQPRLQRR